MILGVKYSFQPALFPACGEEKYSFKEIFKEIVQKSRNFTDILLFLMCEKSSLKDLYPSSPCRNASLSKRIDLSHDISRMNEFFAGGFSHSIGQDDSPISSNKSENSSDEDTSEIPKKIANFDEKTNNDINDTIDEDIEVSNENKLKKTTIIAKKSTFSNYSELNSGELKKLSNDLDEKKTLEHLRNAELSGYQHADLGCIKENIDDEQDYNFTTDEELMRSEDSFSQIEEEVDSKIGSNTHNSHLSLENNGSSSELPEKAKFSCMQIKLFNKRTLKNSPLLQEIQGSNKSESENVSLKNYDGNNESPTKSKQKRNSLFDRRNLSPLSSPLLPFNLEIQTPKLGELFKANIHKTPDTSVYEKEIAKKYEFFIANRPANLERTGIRSLFKEYSLLENPQKSSLSIILSNISLSSSCALLKDQRKIDSKMKIFAEVGLAYLTLYDKKIKDGHCQYKCSPPIRDKENRQYLRAHMIRNSVDLLGSAHIRVPFKYKIIDEGNFRRAFSGLSTVGVNLQIIWSIFHSLDKQHFISKINEKIKMLVKLLAVNPAKILKIHDRKGSLSKGKDADFFIWKPLEIVKIRKENILVKDKSMYVFKNHKFYGKVYYTYLRGNKVWDCKTKEDGSVPMGEIIRRKY